MSQYVVLGLICKVIWRVCVKFYSWAQYKLVPNISIKKIKK